VTPGLISVLIPSRRRTRLLTATTAGLLERARCPQDVEFLVAADPDDEETRLLQVPQAWILVTPERWGYQGLDRYYNALARAASGEWLLVWGDDAILETDGWDEVIRAEPPAILWARSCVPGAPEGSPSEFPVLPAAWVRHLGRVTGHFSADLWINMLAALTGTGRHIPLVVTHGDTPDATAAERTFGGPGFGSGVVRAGIEGDARKLRELLAMEVPQ
jgi:hypothetical protein